MPTEQVAKQKIADEISQMIIANLKKYQDEHKASVLGHQTRSFMRKSPKKRSYKKVKRLRNKHSFIQKPNIEKFILPLKKSKAPFSHL